MDANERYADPRATKELPLGDCRCEGSPHVNGDTAVVRISAGWAEMGSAWGAGKLMHEDGSAYYDEALGDATAIARFTRSWSLVDLDEKKRQVPRPITVTNVLLLDQETFKALKEHVDALAKADGRLPNASSGPSVDSSRGTASRRRATTRT